MPTPSISKVQVSEQHRQILSATRNQALTTREIAQAIGVSQRDTVSPRIAELCHAELLIVRPKRKCSITGKTVQTVRASRGCMGRLLKKPVNRSRTVARRA